MRSFCAALMFLAVPALSLLLREERPFSSPHWYRFTLTAAPRAPVRDTAGPVFGLSLAKSSAYGSAQSCFRWACSTEKGRTILKGRLLFSSDTARAGRFVLDLKPGSPVTLEAGFTFREDSLIAVFFADGALLFKDSGRYYMERQVVITDRLPDSLQLGAIWAMDDFGASDKRLFAFPPTAQPVSDTVADGLIFLRLAPFFTRYRGEAPAAVHWRIRDLSEPDRALFDELSEDPAFFSRLRVPLFAKTGDYGWSARFRNNFGNWGEWSPARTLTLSGPSHPFFQIESLWLEDAGSQKGRARLEAGTWHRLRMKVRNLGRPWKDFGFFIVRLSSTGYLFGNTLNKGGPFRPTDNYVFNLSAQPDSFQWWLFEKRWENSLRSEHLPADSVGLTLDASRDEVVADTSKGLFGFRFRLLQDARPGPWTLRAHAVSTRSAFFKNGVDELSEFKDLDVIVEQPRKRRVPAMRFAGALVLLLGAVLFIRRRRALRPQAAIASPVSRVEDPEYRPIREYLEKHLFDPNLNVEKVRTDLGIGKNRFFQILKRNAVVSLPNRINELRIEKAKELLRDPNKNITEIGFEVGYVDSSYFSRVFKSTTGHSPSDFRNASKD